jgi:4-amino-4-deoxy-L-arabinose transferase-like glycosyltransferase
MAAADGAGGMNLRHIDRVLLFILLGGLIVRVYMAVEREYVHDEDNTAIPISETISFAPGNLNLPLRGENHPALPAYVVKVGSSLFGTSRLGYRLMHVLLGLAIVAAIFRLTREWYGLVPARWAAALLTFNEYYLNVSSRATAHVPTLLLVTGAVYAFSRFLATDRAIYLYAAGASTGLAFYCKESTGLLLPVFLLTLLFTRHRRALLRPHVYLAVALYALIISPDVMWNLNTDPATVTVTYNGETHAQATYLAHLRRVGGLGFSPYPSMFYFRDTIRSLYARTTGNSLVDATPEYFSVNVAIGLLLVGAVLFTTFGPVKREPLRIFLLVMFWGIFTFFTLIKKGDPPGRLDPVSWMWVETTIIPAIVVAGARLEDFTGNWRRAVWTVTGLALLTACVRLVLSQ